MARLDPFAAIRYDARLVDPNDVVAPPYDVVSPAERAELAAKSPYNAIAIELPVPDRERKLDQYENAAFIFASWLESRVVRQDTVAGFYIYRMSFDGEEGNRRTMTGVLGALGLDLDNTGEVMPHEQTTPKDRQDRLSLLRSTRLNTSPIWALSLANGLTSACREALEKAGECKWRATDEAGAVHELWPVTDEYQVAEISELAASAKVLLADGHHRYQTARDYAFEQRAANGNLPGGYDLVMAFVVELSNEELSIRPIHRLLKGISSERLLELIRPWYRVEEAPGGLGGLPSNAEEGVIGLFTHDGYRVLYPLPALEQASEDDLDPTRLEVVLNALPDHELIYEPDWPRAETAVEKGRADAAFRLNPVRVAEIETVANGGRLMAPKSTYFYPKLRTGMAFRCID